MYLRSSIISTTYVIVIDWIIPTVRKHIVPQETLACACVAVGVEEAAERWIVISALEVVEARLHTILLPLNEKMAGPNTEESIERWAGFESGIIVSNGDTLPFYYTSSAAELQSFICKDPFSIVVIAIAYPTKGEGAAIAHPTGNRHCAVFAFSSFPDNKLYLLYL